MTVAIDHGTLRRHAIAPAWHRPVIHLGIAALAILVLFHRDAIAMATIWWTVSTWQHCLLVAPIVAWLVWQRRGALADIAPLPWRPGLAVVAVGALGWLLGEAGGIAIARHLGLVMMLQGTVIALLGLAVARTLAFPLTFALLLVPFGEFLVQPLQTLTAAMCMALLDLFGVPATIDGVLIRIPNGYFEVAEACAGANFVLAMAAYATLAAHVCFRTWRQRAAFMAFALAMPVLANGVRAFATIWVAWLTDVDAAAGFDHIVYGWFFFAFVMAGVMVVAWRFYDPPAPVAAAPNAVERTMVPMLALTLVIALAALPLGWSRATALRIADIAIDLPAIPGWQRVAPVGEPWTPHYAGADLRLMGHYRDASGATVDLAIAAFARQEEGRELVGFGQGPIAPNSRWIWTASGAPVANGKAERITGPGGMVREVVTFYRVGGMTTGSETRVKIETLKARLLASDPRAVAIIVSGGDRAAIDRFIAAADLP